MQCMYILANMLIHGDDTHMYVYIVCTYHMHIWHDMVLNLYIYILYVITIDVKFKAV